MTEERYALYCRLVQICANIGMLAGVVVGMYHAAHTPETTLATFSQWFFPILLVSLGGAWVAVRCLRRAYRAGADADDNVSVVHLPRLGLRRTRWTVLHTPSAHARRV